MKLNFLDFTKLTCKMKFPFIYTLKLFTLHPIDLRFSTQHLKIDKRNNKSSDFLLHLKTKGYLGNILLNYGKILYRTLTPLEHNLYVRQ